MVRWFRILYLSRPYNVPAASLPVIAFQQTGQGTTCHTILIIDRHGTFCRVFHSACPPYYWYYIPEITAIILISSFGLGVIFQQYSPESRKQRAIQGSAAVLLIPQSLGIFYLLARDGLRLREMPIHTNWATHEQYREIGEWLQENNDGRTILINGEIGTLGYYCDCSLSSFFSDRKWLGQYVRQQPAGDGIRAILYRIKFLFFDQKAEFPQPAYLLSEFPCGKRKQNGYRPA